jgi:hypothetical protein
MRHLMTRRKVEGKVTFLCLFCHQENSFQKFPTASLVTLKIALHIAKCLSSQKKSQNQVKQHTKEIIFGKASTTIKLLRK